MKTQEVEWAAVHRSYEFNLNKTFAVIPNVSYGAFSWGEADLIAVSKAGYLTEGEIKISVADLRAEFKKKKYIVGSRENVAWKKDIKKHIFIVPEEMKDRALELISHTDSGLIYITKNTHDFSAFTDKEAVSNKSASKMEQDRILKICRLICFRYWTKKELV